MLQHNILFAGCGDLGGAAATLLVQAGHSVTAIRRTPGAVPPGVHHVSADLASGVGLQQLENNFDAVVYVVSAGRSGAAAYRAAYVAGLRNLLNCDGIRSAGRLVFVSSTSVYGQSDGEWVDADSPTSPQRFNGQIMLEAEHLAVSQPGGVALRLGGIYGPGRERMLGWVREQLPCVADPPQFTNRIHRDDAARAIVHLLNLAQPQPIYIGTDNDPAPQHVVLDWIADELGLDAVPRHGKVRAVGSKRCANTALLDSGFEFDYPTFRDGYAALIKARSTT